MTDILIPAALLCLSLAISAAAFFAAKIARDRFGLEVSKADAERWRSMVERAVEFGFARAGYPIDIPDLSANVLNDATKFGADYLKRYARDTMDRMGVPHDAFGDLFEPVIAEKRRAAEALKRFPPAPLDPMNRPLAPRAR